MLRTGLVLFLLRMLKHITLSKGFLQLLVRAQNRDRNAFSQASAEIEALFAYTATKSTTEHLTTEAEVG